MDNVCDICGEPATQSAFDLLIRDNISTGLKEFKHGKLAKYGCDEHPVFSLIKLIWVGTSTQ